MQDLIYDCYSIFFQILQFYNMTSDKTFVLVAFIASCILMIVLLTTIFTLSRYLFRALLALSGVTKN